jgi:hypothetical protein
MNAVFHPRIGNANNNLHSFINTFKIGPKKDENLHHPFFNFDVKAFPQNKKVEIPFIKKNMKEPNKEPIKKAAPIALQNFKVDKMKSIPIENPFQEVTKNIEPLQHKNPQYYQFKLYKNSLQDIAFKHMDEEISGEPSDITRALQDFWEFYDKKLHDEYDKDVDDIENIETITHSEREDLLNELESNLIITKGTQEFLKSQKKQGNIDDVAYFKHEIEKLDPNRTLNTQDFYKANKILEHYNLAKFGKSTKIKDIKPIFQKLHQKLILQNANFKNKIKNQLKSLSKKKKPEALDDISDKMEQLNISGGGGAPETKQNDDEDDDEEPKDIDYATDDIAGEILHTKQTFAEKSMDELQAYIADANADMIIETITQKLTTKEKIDEMIEALTQEIETKRVGKTIGKKKAQDLNKILRDNGKIKYINGNSGSKALLAKRNGLIAVSLMEGF